MKREEFSYWYGVYREEIAQRKNKDYVVNEEQMRKFKEAYDFFIGLVDRHHGVVESVDLIPKEEHGGMTCELPLMYLHGTEMQDLSKIISYMSAISIDANTDGVVCVSFTVPNVFVHK